MEDKKIFNKWNIILISFFIIGITSIVVSRKLPAYDYWWHVKAGEYIIKNKTIPFIDVFSWFGIKENLYWHSHEWLSEVVIYFFSILFGNMGGYVFSVVTLFTLVLILFLMNKESYFKNIKFSIIWIILGVLIIMPVVTARPHMISFILLVFTMYLLSDLRNNEHSKKIYFLPIISILWANFHGGSSNLPYILTFLVLGTGLFNFKIGRLVGIKLTHKQQVKLLIVGILSILVLMINPHGLDIITYPYLNMNDSLMLNVISEWRSPDLKQSSDIFIFLELFIIFVPLLFIKEDLDFTDMALVGSMVLLTFKSVRFSVLLYIVASFIIFKYVLKLKDNKAIKQFSLFLGVIGIIFFVFFIIEIPNIKNEPMKTIISDEVIDVIKEENPKRLYNDYDLGGYLIYKDIKVFIDGRADMYSKYNLKDVVNLSKLDDGVEEIISKYNFDMFVIYKQTSLNYYLKYNKNYSKLIEHDNIIVYKNNGGNKN